MSCAINVMGVSVGSLSTLSSMSYQRSFLLARALSLTMARMSKSKEYS